MDEEEVEDDEDVRVPTIVSMAADERSAISDDEDDEDDEENDDNEDEDDEDGSLTATATPTGCGGCKDGSVCDWVFEAGDDADNDDADADADAMRASKSGQWKR